MRRKLSSVLVVLLVLSSTTVAVQPVAAAEAGNCSALDDFVMFATIGLVNADSCSRAAYVDASVEDMLQNDANQTKVEVYNGAVGVQAGSEAWAAPYDNYLNDTESIAWMKAQVAVANAYENGSTKSQSKVAAREAIAAYYTTKQLNLIEQWNVSVGQIRVLSEESKSSTYVNRRFVDFENFDESGSNGNLTFTKGPGFSNVSHTLVNSSTHDVLSFEATREGDGFHHGYVTLRDGNKTFPPATVSGVHVLAPNSNYDNKLFFKFQPYADRWDHIEQMNSDLQNETDNFVDATWEDYDSGAINASDVISSHTAMFEYGVRSANESESLWRSTAALAMMGFDTPNLTSSGTMTVRYHGTDRTGLVLARHAPNGSWVANTTYNTSNFDGPVFMATTDGKKVDFEENETFTVKAMTAKDGSSVQTVNTTKYVYKTANTSELLALQQQLIELRAEIEARKPIGGGGGSGFDPSSSQMVLLLAAVAGVALLASKEDF